MKLLISAFSSRVVLLAVLVLAAIPLTATAFDDADALKGVTTGKAVFDITIGNPAKLALYLSIIEETYQGLVRQGVKPDLIVAFHGEAITLVSKNREKAPKDQLAVYDDIAMLIKDLKELGVKFEGCSIAARLLKVDPASLYPEIKVVGNTFISLMGYQNRGYAYIPIF